MLVNPLFRNEWNMNITKSALLPNIAGEVTYHAFVGLKVRYAGDVADCCYSVYECTETGQRRVWGCYDAKALRWRDYQILNN